MSTNELLNGAGGILEKAAARSNKMIKNDKGSDSR